MNDYSGALDPPLTRGCSEVLCFAIPACVATMSLLLKHGRTKVVYSLGENSCAELHETRHNCNDSASKMVW